MGTHIIHTTNIKGKHCINFLLNIYDLRVGSYFCILSDSYRQSALDYLVSPRKEDLSYIWSSFLLFSPLFHLFCNSSEVWRYLEADAELNTAVIYSGTGFLHMHYFGLVSRAFHLPYFYPVTQYHDIFLQLFTVSLMTIDHFVSTPTLVTSSFTPSSKSFMTRLKTRCLRISPMGSRWVPYVVAILLKYNAFSLRIK